ncbi:hypothetical protein COCNU_05G000300 [Cocos nucifera]|uniref:PQ-loop repeat family protein n=1 Tax=Cocos nucifera TaxID=13894 RepID=A0A8K0N1I9_COCNU|nr:hypothetical protein COCNU_05G000300 [Cocos nucifera]
MAKSPEWASCAEEKKACVGWIDKYFKDCVCSLSGEVSFGLGLISLVCWGIAEIPQIITNFQTKSGHGVSLGLILTWVIGCLPNSIQHWSAFSSISSSSFVIICSDLQLYTATTVVLLFQTLYYDYWLRWRKSKDVKSTIEVSEVFGQQWDSTVWVVLSGDGQEWTIWLGTARLVVRGRGLSNP